MKEEIKKAIESAYHNRNLMMPEIAAIMNQVRQAYAIDRIYLVTNRDYKYQLSHVMTCRAEGMKFLQKARWTLTKEQYQQIVEQYVRTPISTEEIPELDQMLGGAYLHAGILREQSYFGTMVFWSEEKRDWTEEEKEVLEALCGLCLIFFGLNNMVHGFTQYEMARRAMESRHVLTGLFLDLDSGKCHLVKLAPFLEGVFTEWEDYETFLEHYIRNYMDPVYGQQVAEVCGLDALRETLSKDHQSILLECPRQSDNRVNWIRYRLDCNTFREDGKPQFAMIRFLDITQEMQKEAYLSSATGITRNTFTVIASASMETGRYAIYVDNRQKVEHGKEPYGSYSALHEDLLKHCIPEEYGTVFRDIFRMEAVREHFDHSKDSLQYEFPCQTGEGAGWVRLEAVKSPDYEENGRRVILYYSDITEQKNREIRIEMRTRELERKAKERKELAEHDPLTGVYNRRGYTTVLERCKEEQRPCAYLQVDVDNFKSLNDSYGHDYGDAVLQEVAKVLKESFREGDYVFRFGGDEFAVLLVNCSKEAWKTISEKQQRMHAVINEVLKKDRYLSLSIGCSWSPAGFDEEMVSMADQALYYAKGNGRAGCCAFDEKHKPVYTWRDPSAPTFHVGQHAQLEQRGTGFCTVEMPEGKLENGRLNCNETARIIMGFPIEMPPEECFKVWLNRVDPSSRMMLHRTWMVMQEKGRAECTYLYHHPLRGIITVRSGGSCEETEKGLYFSGYHQSLADTEVVQADLEEED